MIRRFCTIFALIVVVVCCRNASAHFLWLTTDSGEKPAQARLWFSETCEPGDAKLLDKVAKTQIWFSRPGDEAKPLNLEKQIAGELGSWSAAIDAAGTDGVEATCDYGVVSRGGESFLLQYDARHVDLARGDELAKAIALKSLPLDVLANVKDGSLVLNVQFDGKPAADAELLAVLPSGDERDLKLDATGAARIDDAAAGDYAFRARVVQKTPGERDGKKYDEVRHYSTLTFHLPAKSTAMTATKVADVDPAEVLRRARDKRAVWENFPGFSADVDVRIDGDTETGRLEVDENGVATVKLKNEKLSKWAEDQASSLVQHRLPGGFEDENPAYADEDVDHPLGRLINLGDKQFGSAYRIKDDMVMEVNRHGGPVRFTISVLETELNKEGKYLPRTFSITTWDQKSGEIKSSSSFLNTWTRVGNFDVPLRILEIETTPGDRKIREITFSNYKLIETKK